MELAQSSLLLYKLRFAAPVLAIAEVAKQISETHGFQDRVAVSSSDEVGVLAESFNAMLEEIGRRIRNSPGTGNGSEEQVAERSRVNAELRTATKKAEEVARRWISIFAPLSRRRSGYSISP